MPPGFYPDEAIYANNGVEAWETGEFKIFYPENNGREGLWPNIIGFFIVNFGHEPWVPRSVAAVFGILTVLGVYFLTKELFKQTALLRKPSRSPSADGGQGVAEGDEQADEQASPAYWARRSGLRKNEILAFLSAFFLATSFWHILFSRIGFRAIMAPFFLVWGIYFLLLALNKNFSHPKPARSKIKQLAMAGLGGIFYGLGFYSYIAYRATPLLIFIIILLYWFQNKDWQIRKKILLSTFCFLLFTFIVAAPLGLYFLENPQDFLGRTTQISVFNSPSPLKDLSINILKTAGMFNFSGDYNWRHNIAGKPLLFWPVGILFLIGIFLGLRTFFKKRFQEEYSQAFLILFSWLIITALPIVISNEGIPHSLRAILMAPAIFILAGVGGIWLYQWATKYRAYRQADELHTKLRKIFLLSTFYFLLLLLVVEVYISYFIVWGKSEHISGAFSQNYVEIGRELNALPKELPKYVLVEAGGVDVRGIPMPAQTVMFITDTFEENKREEKNIFYILPKDKDKIPAGAFLIILK